MGTASLLPLLMAAVCGYVGMYYLWMYARRREDRENLYFALTCISIALYDLFCAGLYDSRTLEQGMFWQRFQFASLALFAAAISWFVRHFTGASSRRPYMIITAWMGLLCAGGLLLDGNLTLSLARPRIKHVRLGSLVDITYYEVDPGPFYDAQYVSMVLVSLYLLWVIAGFYRREGRRPARALLISLCVFFAAALNDIFVGAGVYGFIFLVEYAYMVIILSMAYVLLNRFIDLHHEVGALNLQLRQKVNERTMELFFSEIGTRLYDEMLRGFPAGKGRRGARRARADAGAARGAAAIEELGRDLSVVSNLEELLRRTLAKALEISAASGGCIYTVDAAGSAETVVNGDGFGIREGVKPAGAAAKAWREKKAVTRMKSAGTPVSESCVPVLLRGRVLGMVCLCWNDGPGKVTGTLEAFLSHVSVALENALLYRTFRAEEAAGRQARITPAVEDKLARVMEYIRKNYTADLSREGLAAMVGLHHDSLGRFFKMHTGRKIGDYINSLRVREAARLLRESDASIVSIAFAVGFESLPTFNRVFLKEMRVSPSAWRAGTPARSFMA